jgi:hypothetical protein
VSLGVPAQLLPACVLLWDCCGCVPGVNFHLFSGVLAARLAFSVLKLHMAVGAGVWAGGEAYMQLVGLPSEAMPVATAWTEGCGGQNHLAILATF